MFAFHHCWSLLGQLAKGHLKNVDKYNKQHKWRDEHTISHLAEEEADTHKWAFPVSPKKAVLI